MASIAEQVKEALDNAVENGYDHEFKRDPSDVVLEIHDWSGIEGFDHECEEHVAEGERAVREWRTSGRWKEVDGKWLKEP